MENLHTPKLLTRCINLPEDLLYYILIFLDINKLEELGFNFKPSEFNKNIQKNILWKSWSCEIQRKIPVPIPPKQFKVIFDSTNFQYVMLDRTNPVVYNILSNYCNICNCLMKPSINIFKNNNHYILCNHIPFSSGKVIKQ